MKRTILIISLLFISSPAHAVILPGLVDIFGNPVHSEDEVDVQIHTVVQTIPQGYHYTYTLTSMQSSLQNLYNFEVYLPDPYTSIVLGFEASPWQNSQGDFPNNPADPTPAGFVYSPEVWSIGWVALYPQFEIQPGATATGFTFVSPYPPGNAEGYVSGLANPPVTAEDGPNAPEFYHRTKYGSGKIVPVIGPVKSVTPNVTDNYSVVGCIAGICDVQLDITGPQDPYGTAYNYLWTGAFGTATGAKPLVQLAPGAYQVSVAISDPYATLVTATMPITVVDPNPAAIITPAQAAALTPVQLANLIPAQVVSVFAALSPAQVPMLAPVQLTALTPTQVAISVTTLSPAQIAALSPQQLGGLTPTQISVITPNLTTAQLATLQQMHDHHDDKGHNEGDDKDRGKDKGKHYNHHDD